MTIIWMRTMKGDFKKSFQLPLILIEPHKESKRSFTLHCISFISWMPIWDLEKRFSNVDTFYENMSWVFYLINGFEKTCLSNVPDHIGHNLLLLTFREMCVLLT